jgi:UDP-N-acetylglucosamine 4,6-dehydratase
MITNKKILLIGGTGSLGYEIVSRYLDENQIWIYSRDECKQWKMKLDFYNKPNLKFIIGDIIDFSKVEQSILRVKPQIIIMAAAMKHIDQCEYNTDQSLNTNLLGNKNILDSIESNQAELKSFGLETILFVSSDKACSPINVYGMCKALSETLIVEKAHYIKCFKWLNIRYGNVLNSRGSIIPLLHSIGKDSEKTYFPLTDENMTRFVMTLSQSVDLIEHAILYGESGSTVIPKLISMRIKHLLEIFSEIYNKPIKITGSKPGEKLLESLINVSQSFRIKKVGDYMHIKSSFDFKPDVDMKCVVLDEGDYNSRINPLDKESLRKYLIELNLI